MKKSSLLLILFSFLSCECDQEPLEEVLGNPCYTNGTGEIITVKKFSYDYEKANIGACSTGFTDKNENGTLICSGEIRATEETCNGIDDNCNQYIDDDYSGYAMYYPYYSEKNTCVSSGVCKYSAQECVDGQWICHYPAAYGPEVCDGWDNDCDDQVDEDTEEEPLFTEEERFVYSGDPSTINIGECRAGYKECVDGVVSVRNMRTPTTEICGNDDDDDCDGATDELENTNTVNDFALVIDYSGSMNGIIDSVADALCAWSSQGTLQTSRFAVVAVGFAGGGNREIQLLTDFTDSGTACDIMRVNNTYYNSGFMEYQLDAIFDINNPQSEQLYLDWQSENRKVITFSDEMLQQGIAPTIEEAIEMIVQQCQDVGYIIGSFVRYNIQDQTRWVDMTQRCGGFLDYLSYNPTEMIEQLNYWLGSNCGPN